MKTIPRCGAFWAAILVTFPLTAAEPDGRHALTLHARSRVPDPEDTWEYHVVHKTLDWDARKTAIIVCDMWDKHWCSAASARVGEMAPRMNDLLVAARKKGVLVIHAPSGTMEFYKDTPQRKLAQAAPKAEPKVPLKGWCGLDLQRERPLPIDDADGGCDAPGDKPHQAWTRQIDGLKIEPGDALTDSAEAYNLIQQRGIENVILLGVHTNMCVLGRPFGIRQMIYQGKNVVLVRDMTDAMYNPRQRPQVSHFRGTELVVEHVEKFWCPTITGSDFLGGPAFRFPQDKRPHVAFLVSEDEYRAADTLPDFAHFLQDSFGCYCTVVLGRDKNDLTGIEALKTADVAVLYVRRRTLPKEQMEILRTYLDAGRPLVALRTASHAFAADGKTPDGYEQWRDFDRDVLGCQYRGHGPNQLGADVAVAADAAKHPILAGIKTPPWHSRGSLYKNVLIDAEAKVLLSGSAMNLSEPVAWTRSYKGGRVFYTSLGHRSDFAQPQFQMLLIGAIHWAMNRPVPKLAQEAPARTR
jgi:type 1 glutamine amidotransferase/nicotinamidase-related amidase